MSTLLQFYAHQAWQEQLQDINHAHRSICIERFIFDADTIGRHYAEALMARARAGVSVRVYVDAAGSVSLLRASLRREMMAAGVELRFFNIPGWHWPRRATRLIDRNHRKLTIIDDRVTHIGGPGIQDRMQDWRDTNYRTTDAHVITQVQQAFDQLWQADDPRQYQPAAHDYTTGPHIIANGLGPAQRHIHRSLVEEISHATTRVSFTTPYWIPTPELRHEVCAAAQRGVAVQVFVPQRSDHRISDMATSANIGPVLAAGGAVYYFQPTLLHAKTAVIDDRATIGSTNFDHLSLRHSLELNVTTAEPGVVESLAAQFEKDRQQSRQVDPVRWQRRSMVRKAGEWIGNHFWRLL